MCFSHQNGLCLSKMGSKVKVSKFDVNWKLLPKDTNVLNMKVVPKI